MSGVSEPIISPQTNALEEVYDYLRSLDALSVENYVHKHDLIAALTDIMVHEEARDNYVHIPPTTASASS